MTTKIKTALAAATFVAGAAVSTLATAQPLNVLVNPANVVTDPFGYSVAVVRAPFELVFAPIEALAPVPPNVYNPKPAAIAAVEVRPDLYGVVPTPVLKATGPRYDNPANSDYRHAIVMRRGATVPGYINTAPVENVSTPGLAPGGRYSFFVAPDQKIVFLDTDSRRVVRVTR